MDYYQITVTGSFDATVAAVKQFARMDAARFRLRDSLRAQEIISKVGKYPSAYVEAGAIHYSLWRLLRKLMVQSELLQLIYLSDDALKTTGDSSPQYGPGDQLMLLYMSHPNLAKTRREELLAARSIIFSKINAKEELTDDIETL